MSILTNRRWEEIVVFLKDLENCLSAAGIPLQDQSGKLRSAESVLDSIENAVLAAIQASVEESRSAEAPEEAPGEMVDHPAHYNRGKRECIAEMELLFGPADVAGFCRCSAYKYRTRAGSKPGNPAEQDLAKADWYIDYLENMIARLTKESETSRIGFESNNVREETA